MNKKNIFISWANFQRRNISIAPYFGAECVFLGKERSRNIVLHYLVMFFSTVRFLFVSKPDVIWVQVPPLPALSAVIFYKLISFRTIFIIADCHNSMLRPKWSTLPTAIWHLNQCDLVLVHNSEQIPVISEMGVTVKSLVLEDSPAVMDAEFVRKAEALPRFIFPASFAEDEPIAELMAAAKTMPDCDFFITGNVARAHGRHDLSDAPGNVYFTGFLSLAEFESLFKSSDVVIGLTRFEGIQLSVCNEAVGAGKPMVLSDTLILRKLFSRGAVFVNSAEPDSIADGCRLALANIASLEAEVLSLCLDRRDEWEKLQANVVKSCIYK